MATAACCELAQASGTSHLRRPCLPPPEMAAPLLHASSLSPSCPSLACILAALPPELAASLIQAWWRGFAVRQVLPLQVRAPPLSLLRQIRGRTRSGNSTLQRMAQVLHAHRVCGIVERHRRRLLQAAVGATLPQEPSRLAEPQGTRVAAETSPGAPAALQAASAAELSHGGERRSSQPADTSGESCALSGWV